MSHGYAPNDTRHLLKQQPQLSDDFEAAKNSSFPTDVHPVVIHKPSYGGGVLIKRTAK